MSGTPAWDLAGLLAAANPDWRLPATPSGRDPEREADPLPPPVWLDAALRVLGPRAPALLVIDGPRQTGKSALLAQLARHWIAEGHPPQHVCRLPLEHGPLRWIAPEALIEAWQALSPGGAGSAGRPGLLLVDDFALWPAPAQDSLAQFALDGRFRVVVAGVDLEACRRRWQARGLALGQLALRPLNFAEFLALRGETPALPPAPRSLRLLFDWQPPQFEALAAAATSLERPFADYLGQGGYPAAVRAPDAAAAQRELREQVLMRALRWDAPGRHGVRRVDQLEAALSGLAIQAGRLLDMPAWCAGLEVERPTARHFLLLLEQAGLLARVPPLGYGDQVQRARFLVCLGDPALGPALLWQAGAPAGKAQALSALWLHLRDGYTARGGALCYAPLGSRHHALVVSAGTRVLPFALHWPEGAATGPGAAALRRLCAGAGLGRGYLATAACRDFGLLPAQPGAAAIMRVPLALLCWWLAQAGRTPAEPD